MKRRTKDRIAALVVLALALCLMTLSAGAAQTKVSRGIFVQGIDCAGMTREELSKTLKDKVHELGKTVVTMKIGDQTLTSTLHDLGLRWSNKEIVDEILNLGTTGNVVQRYKDQMDLQNKNREYSLKFKLKSSVVNDFAKGLAAYNCEPVNAKIYTTGDLTPGVEGGTNGILVDTEEAAQLLRRTVKKWDGSGELSVEIPVESTPPEVTYEELAKLSDVLGTATTDYSASSAARAVNVENGCQKISGTLLYPGETFSVTAAVTPFTAENGYEQAPSYEENRVVDSYGGGICQVSTTLYNAVLKAELEVVSRSNHTMVVGYVPLSKDAAIAEGVMDMAFINTNDDPIYIIGYTYGGTITFTIYGHETRPANRTLEFESRTIQTIEPTNNKLVADPTQNVGYILQTQSPHTGYVAELWKNIYIDGVFSESVQINSSTYTAVGTAYSIGTASPYPIVTQQMIAAINTGSLANVQATIANVNTYIAQQQQAQQQQQQAQQQPQQQSQQQQGGGAATVVMGDVDDLVPSGAP